MVAGGMLPTFDDDEDFECQGRTSKGGTTATNITCEQQLHSQNLQLASGGGKLHLGSKLSQSQFNLQGQQQPVGAPSVIYLMTLLSAMSGFLFGYDTGIVSGAMVFVRKIFRLNSLWQELVVSITILGAWILSLMAGSLSERYGRKTIILYASVVFTVGSIIMGAAWSKYMLLFGRLVVGMAIGMASTVVPMYIAELAPSNIRGSLVTLNNCFITVGQLAASITAGAFSYDHENGWRWMLALAAIPAVFQFAGFMFMPESPRWLIRHQRDDEALVALKRIRGTSTSGAVLREFEKIRQNQLDMVIQEDRRKQQKRNVIVAIFRKTATRRALTVGCLLMAAQQLAGINTVMYYTATIIEMSGVQSASAAVWLAVPTSAAYVVFSFCGYLVADRFGRRPLTLCSQLGVVMSLLLLATGFHLTSLDGAPVTAVNMSTLEACYSSRDCPSCLADPRCGFCYDTISLTTAICLERNPLDPTRSREGPCSASPPPAQNKARSHSHHLSQQLLQQPQQQTAFAFADHICPSKTQGIGLNTWLVLTGLVVYLAAYAPGMSPMPWTINSEIYPMWARSFCYSIATSVNWMFNMLITLTFISLTELVTTHGAFYLYAFMSSVCWIFLFWKLPETRGRSLEDISSLFAKSSSHNKPDDQEDAMDDSASSTNQSSCGGPTIGLNDTSSTGQQRRPTIMGTGVGGHNNGHENLAFATDNMRPLELVKSAPTTDQRTMVAAAAAAAAALEGGDRSPSSLKLSNPLSKSTIDMAMSQPELQHQQKVPMAPPPSLANLISSSVQPQHRR